MLFRKNIERRCSYCIHSTKLDEDQVLCSKMGIQPMDASCRKFSYDPCKRIPVKAKALDFSKYQEEDFSL
jgi:hypothetical protein